MADLFNGPSQYVRLLNYCWCVKRDLNGFMCSIYMRTKRWRPFWNRVSMECAMRCRFVLAKGENSFDDHFCENERNANLFEAVQTAKWKSIWHSSNWTNRKKSMENWPAAETTCQLEQNEHEKGPFSPKYCLKILFRIFFVDFRWLLSVCELFQLFDVTILRSFEVETPFTAKWNLNTFTILAKWRKKCRHIFSRKITTTKNTIKNPNKSIEKQINLFFFAMEIFSLFFFFFFFCQMEN